ncbi:hypothetical protein [uncultured Algibacter sp.]|uniref:hypothetical protein n=1 Tax=uncultured Algibacter sp. TaxID=298659 RepID=UPI003216D637
MKKSLTFFAVLCFVFANAQFKTGTIFFKDSTSINGLVKTKIFGGVKFKLSKDSKIESYDYKQLYGFNVSGKKFRYIKGNYSATPRLLNELTNGKITLYSNQVYNPGHTIPNGFSGGGMTFGGGTSTVYFMKVKGSLVRLGIKVKNKHKIYFKDCPLLIEKIENKELYKFDVLAIINFYNENCGS